MVSIAAREGGRPLVNFFTKWRYTSDDGSGRGSGRGVSGSTRVLGSEGEAVMPKKDRGFPLTRAGKALQENITRSGRVAGAAYTLVGGIVFLGGLGYWLDGRWNTAPWLLLTGLMLGIVVGFYELVKTVWPR